MKYQSVYLLVKKSALLFALFLTSFLSTVYGQGWVKTYENVPELKDVYFMEFKAQKPDELILLADSLKSKHRLIYLDQDGNFKRQFLFEDKLNYFVEDIFFKEDTIIALKRGFVNSDFILEYYKESKKLIKSKIIDKKFLGYDQKSKIGWSWKEDTIEIEKINVIDFKKDSIKVLSEDVPIQIINITSTTDGYIYVFKRSTGTYYLIKYDFNSNFIWSAKLNGIYKLESLKLINSDSIYLITEKDITNKDQRHLTEYFYSQNGTILSEKDIFLKDNLLNPNDNISDSYIYKSYLLNKHIVILKEILPFPAYDLTIIDSKTHEITCQSIILKNSLHFLSIGDVIESEKEEFYINGLPYIGTKQLAKLTKYGTLHSNELQVRYFKDDNKDCVWSPGELLLKDKRIKVEDKSGAFTYFSSQGDTILASLDTGKYNITPQMTTYYRPCNDKETFSFSKYYDTVRLDIALQPEVHCPYLNVEISAPFLRRCFNNTYSVHYCNTGSSEAKNAYVEVNLDKYMNYVSSTIPYSSKQGNLLRFDVGNLAINDSGDFQITSFLSCDSTILGQTHCTEAHIYPDSLCTPTSGWDGSRIKVFGECSGDSVHFEIRNASASPMTQKSEYIVVEDDIIMSRKPFQLNANESVRFGIPASGRTYRLEAKQAQGHPGNSKPSITLENCGKGNLSLGFVNQFPQDEADPFVDIDCQQNRGSFDPNDKQGFPNGYGNNKFIDLNQDLEYLIRFQNTGTDTAFTVRVIDTISPYLEPDCIVMGPSSHPYKYRIYDKGVLEVLFDPIALPDSSTNFVGSNGFVKFRISQKIALAIGTKIENTASIYFDNNAPVVTNTTLHTIGENYVIITEIPEIQPPILNVYPNPFSEETIIELNDNTSDVKTLEVFDLHGKKIKQLSFTDNRLVFKRETLTQGMYFFQISNSRKTLTQGRMMVY